MVNNDQIAHDLAIAYINNRYGAEVTGSFSVSTIGNDVTGEGDVRTERLPAPGKIRHKLIKTGDKVIFGLVAKRKFAADGFAVDPVFEQMIEDYRLAYARFVDLLELPNPLPES